MDAPLVNVGIMTEKALSFVFNGEYIHTESSSFLTGEQRALFVNGNIVYNGKLYKELSELIFTGKDRKISASKGRLTWLREMRGSL